MSFVKAVIENLRKRDRASWRRIALITAISLSVLFLIFEISMHILLNSAVDLNTVLAKISEALDRPITAKEIELSAIYGVVLHDVEMRDSQSNSDSHPLMLRAELVRLRPSWKRLIFGKFAVANLRILNGELNAIQTDTEWNVVRLMRELDKKKQDSDLKPSFAMQNMKIVISAPKKSYDKWTFKINKFFLESDGSRANIAVGAINEKNCEFKSELTLVDKKMKIYFYNIPSELGKLIDPKIDWDKIECEANASWGKQTEDADNLFDTCSVHSNLKAAVLTLPIQKSHTCRFEPVRVKTIDWNYSQNRWSLKINDLVSGRTKDFPLRLSLNASGKKNSLERCKIEWEGAIEKIIALAPPNSISEINSFKPNGLSAGNIIIETNSKNVLKVKELVLLARGISITNNDSSVIELLKPGEKINDIRGKISMHESRFNESRFNESRFDFDKVQMNLNDNQLSLNGNYESSKSFDLEVQSNSINSNIIASHMPQGVSINGSIKINLKIKPNFYEGFIECLGNNFTSPDLGAWRLISGKLVFAKASTPRCENLAVEAGTGKIILNGVIPEKPSSQLSMIMTLQNADMKGLMAFAEELQRENEITFLAGNADGNIFMNGTSQKPVLKGKLDLHECSANVNGYILKEIRGQIDFDSTAVSAKGINAKIGNGSISITGASTSKGLNVNVSLNDADAGLFSGFSQGLFKEYSLRGPIDAVLSISGKRSDLAAEGNVTMKGIEVRGPDNASYDNVTGRLKLEKEKIELENMSAKYLGGTANFKGIIPLSNDVKWNLSLQMERAQIEHLTKFAPEIFKGRGQISNLRADISGVKESPKIYGSGNIDGATIKAAFLDTALNGLRGYMSFGPDSMLARDMSFRIGSSNIEIAGVIENFEAPILTNFIVKTKEAYIQDLLSLVPPKIRPLPEGIDIRGIIKTDGIVINGKIDEAHWDGKISLSYGVGELSGLKRPAVGMSGDIFLKNDQLTAPSLAARIGSSETRLEGRLNLRPPYKLSVRLAILDANLSELILSIPSPGLEKLGISGKGTITSQIEFEDGNILLKGLLERGDVIGFGMPFIDVKGSFSYSSQKDILILDELSGRWADGLTSNGYLELDLSSSPYRFKSGGSISNANLAKVIRMLDLGSLPYSGLVNGKIENLKGRFGEKESINGNGEFFIRNAKIPLIENVTFRLFADLIGKDLVIEEGGGPFTIKNGTVHSNDPYSQYPQSLIFKIKNRDLKLEARGYAGLDGSISFNTRYWRANQEAKGASVRGTFSRPIIENALQGVFGNLGR